jgi:hypothetical protein
MKIQWRKNLIAAGLLGSVFMMGCRHCHKQCRDEIITWDCTDCAAQPAPVKKVEAPHSEGTVTVMPVTHTEPQVTEVKKVKPNPGTIAWTVVAPEGPGVCNPGTIEITAEEAEAMGVRPGYTSGALYLVPKSGDGSIVEHADLKEDKDKVDTAIPVKGEK